MRRAAALNMGGSTDPAAVDMLVEALLHDPDRAVREAAAEGLGETATRVLPTRSATRRVSGA